MVRFAQHQRGFTLIEMSIVLVIIGLIVGGILKGQELIESSRQKNLISQVDRVKAGITTFVDRYRAMPGDYDRASTLLSTNVGDGNGNGIIGTRQTAAAGLATGANVAANENVRFWTHLLASDLIGGATVTPVATDPTCFSGQCAAASPLPASSYALSGLSVNYGVHEGTTANAGSSKEATWIIFSRWAAAAAFPVTTSGAAISPQRALQIDLKYDDGIAWEGAIRGVSGTGCGTNATSYTAATTTADCNLAFDTQ